VLEVDLNRYLAPPKSWIVPLIRPKNPVSHTANVLNFNAEWRASGDRLTFETSPPTGWRPISTPAAPPACPRWRSTSFRAWSITAGWGSGCCSSETDVVMCPLPLFHVFAAYPILMSMIASGAHVVFPTPAGYRGEGVFDNLLEADRTLEGTYLITVPTALAALMQRPVMPMSPACERVFGVCPLPVELYNRFEKATGVEIVEGYGLTECTCLVSVNPPEGDEEDRVGRHALPHTHVRILQKTKDGFANARG
jgi:fatty-acyl-CoA synthase